MKILIADPHPEVLAALRLILEHIPEIGTVREASSRNQLLAQCEQNRPDLILLDRDLARPSRMHPQTLAGLLGELNCLCPGCKVVVMSSRFEAAQEALEAGASGFISKTDAPEEVIIGIARFLKNE